MVAMGDCGGFGRGVVAADTIFLYLVDNNFEFTYCEIMKWSNPTRSNPPVFDTS